MSTRSPANDRRPYRKRRRAEREAETRRRITEAAVELHGTVGPARTSISAVAERAGVQRTTVYRHFADEEALFAACSSHWLARHPLPDLTAWAAVRDPGERLARALDELYAWFERGAEMMGNVLRDAPLVPASRGSVEQFGGWIEAAVATLLEGRADGDAAPRVVAAIGHVLAFTTWRSLVREQRLPPGDAVALARVWVIAAAVA